MANLKDAALDFLQMAVAGKIPEAYQKHIGPNFRHHNACFKGDAASLMKGMQENHAQFPKKTFEAKQVLQEGNKVMVFGLVKLKPGDLGIGLMHIFRFEGDRVAELWDMGQPVPENSPNQYGMF